MPNWCMNKLTVSGPAQELKRFVEASIGFPACYPPQEWEKKADPIPDTPYFCFNALIPTPPEVLATGYSARQNQPENAFLRAMAGENGVVSTEYYNDEKLREIFAWTEA